MKKKRHLLSITDISTKEFWIILEKSKKIKDELKKTGSNQEIFKNKTLAMIFEKPSLRTRVSFEAGMTQLGGHAIYLAPSDIGMGSREEPRDVATVISGMCDIIMARTFKHKTVQNLAEHATVPVINALSDMEHPCQILADFMTIWEAKGRLEGLTIAFIGDAHNNVSRTMLLGAALVGMRYRIGAPEQYFMDKDTIAKAQKISGKTDVYYQTARPEEAVQGADVVVTDTWVSMGDEAEKKARLKTFSPYQVTQALMQKAHKNALFLHCLPAYRGNEVAAEVIDGPQSVIFPEAENRLHAQKGLMAWLMGR